MSTENQVQNQEDPQTAELKHALDQVLTGETVSEPAENETTVPIETTPQVSQKAQTRVDLLSKIRELHRLSGKYPILDGVEKRNFARLKKQELLNCVAWYCNQLDPCANIVPEEPRFDSFVGPCLLRANLTVLAFLEKTSQSTFVQRFTGGFRFEGVCNRVESSPEMKQELTDALLAVYSENKEFLSKIVSPTARLLFVNLQLLTSSAQKGPVSEKKLHFDKCKDKIPSNVLQI